MTRNNPTSGRSQESRCSVCRHPDRDAIDRDLTLGVRTQADVARLVGVHPSTVSRHYRNHAQPRLATSMATDTNKIVLGNVIAEHDRLHGIELEILARALAGGDLRLARDMVAEIRKLLVVITDLQKAIGAGKLSDDNGRPPFDVDATRASFEAKLDELAANYRRLPSILKMVEAMEAGEDQEEIDRLMRKASRPPQSKLIEGEQGEVA